MTFDLAGKSYTDVASVGIDYPAMPVWGPGGRSLIFAAGPPNQLEFRTQRVPPEGDAQLIWKTKGSFGAPSASLADGRSLLYILGDPVTSVTDLHLWEQDSNGQVHDRILFGSPTSNEGNPAVSPNGR